MPLFKNKKYISSAESGNQEFRIKININSDGMFYANFEEEFIDAVKGVFPTSHWHMKKYNLIQVISETFEGIDEKIYEMLKVHLTPIVTHEAVIIYNIQSNVSFAMSKSGEVLPSPSYREGAEWENSDMYGNHTSSNRAKGGYSLTVGAKAKMKTTRTYGTNMVVSYKDYYKEEEGGRHLNHSNPAERLNSWGSFTLKSFEEIPYTDESAIYFYNLMLGMANISKMIQEATFGKEKLLQLIQSGLNPLLPNPSSG